MVFFCALPLGWHECMFACVWFIVSEQRKTRNLTGAKFGPAQCFTTLRQKQMHRHNFNWSVFLQNATRSRGACLAPPFVAWFSVPGHIFVPVRKWSQHDLFLCFFEHSHRLLPGAHCISFHFCVLMLLLSNKYILLLSKFGMLGIWPCCVLRVHHTLAHPFHCGVG